jgi:uncharacterized protein (TIGR03083 family)
MTPEEHVAALRRESAAFVLAASATDPGSPVPSCPDWELRDLVHHLAGVHAFFLGTLEGAMAGGTGPVDERRRALPPPSELTLQQFDEGAQLLADRLAEADPAMPVWNWSGADQTAAWIARRMAHEAAVHRYDADLAAGVELPTIDPGLAADGVLEIGEVFLPSIESPARAGVDLSGTLLLRADDVPHAAVRFVADGQSDTFAGTTAGPGESADCLVSGTASDLLLFVWNRIDPDDDRLAVSGDAGVLDRWRALPLFD